MNLMNLHFFQRQEHPMPGSLAQPISYPACEWRLPQGEVDYAHPLNRFVCSWLTSDMSEVARCDEVLDAIAQLETGALAEWYADGDMFCVDFKPSGVQFNQSNVGPEDTDWWNLPEGRFDLSDVKAALQAWRDYLMRLAVA
jgi:hypothetical protein